MKGKERAGICIVVFAILGLAFYISLHVPFYGQDTRIYISAMNASYYKDTMWVDEGALHFDHGMCSMFQFFTIPSLLTGIKPYYTSLFTVRVIGICLFSLVLYRMGTTIFRNKDNQFSWPALVLSTLVPGLLMFWGSNYTAEFYYWRIYEAKGFCQFVLLPIGFSVFLEMFKNGADRKSLWIKQASVGVSAVAVSASSLTPYVFLVFLGTCALIAYDKMKNGWKTIGCAAVCSLTNLIYLGIFILETKGIIVL